MSQTQQEGLTFVTFVSNISVLESEMLALLTGRQLRSSAVLRLLLRFHVYSSSRCVCAQQVNPGDLRALRKGMSLYHSESQLSSLPQRQDAMHVVSIQEEQTGHSAKRGREGGRDRGTNTHFCTTFTPGCVTAVEEQTPTHAEVQGDASSAKPWRGEQRGGEEGR